jgi:two-component system, LytTR family, response regulator
MKAIIVDDEPKAIELIKSYLQHFGLIELIGTFRNGLKAFEFMNQEDVGLIFLDINMPHLSGISLSKMIDTKTKIIFTTAYSDYAVESYEVEATDYLLKPISLERFTKAMSKVLSENSAGGPIQSSTMMIKSGTKIYRVDVDQIAYLMKDGNYMIYHSSNQNIMARESISEALDVLPDHFIQVHKSYIINIHNIDFISSEEISVKGDKIPIGNSFKDSVHEKLG